MKLRDQILDAAFPLRLNERPQRPVRQDVEKKLNAYKFSHESTSDLEGAELLFLLRRQHALSVWNAACAVLMALAIEEHCNAGWGLDIPERGIL